MNTLGRYQIVSQLGRGAMGTVYRAVDPMIERTVAIKTLNPDLPQECIAEIKERFLREAKSAGRLNHPNVVTIYDVGEADGVAYIAMEYLEGQSLRQLLDTGAALSVHTITGIAAQIADALEYAGRLGIVHRDIKPANIMLSPGGQAKLADFGVAYMPSSSMTQTGQVVGSPKYLSPEQVLGQGVDGRADIFSLGVVLYEMLVRKTPFDRPDITVFSLMQLIVTEPAARVSDLNPELPAALDTILGRALAKKREDRYQRAGDFANDLRRYRQPGGTTLDATVISPKTADPQAETLWRPPVSEPDDAAHREKMAVLLADIDTFSKEFEDAGLRNRQEQSLREQAAEKTTKADAGVVEQSQDAPAAKSKSAILTMLREQAEAKARQRPRAQQASPDQVQALSAKMRDACKYLVEFVAQFNEAGAEFAGNLALIYVKDLPPVVLENGYVDYRTTIVDEKQVVDHIALAYRMTSDEKARASINKDEARILKAQLERANLKFDAREIGNAGDKVPRVAFLIECRISATAMLRADYSTLAVEIECRNVGVLGPEKYRIPAAAFNEDTVEEFGKLLLGFPHLLSKFSVNEPTDATIYRR